MDRRLRWLQYVPFLAILWASTVDEAKGIILKQSLPQASIRQKQEIGDQQAAVLFSAEDTLTADGATLAEGNLYHLHTFEGQSGKIVRLTLTSEQFNTFLRLRDSTGQVLATNDNGREGQNAEIVFRLPSTGQYQIEASATASNTGGDYRLAVTLADENALQLAMQKTEADSFYRQGLTRYATHQFADAIASFQSALDLYNELGIQRSQALALTYIGLSHSDLGEHAQSVEFQTNAIALLPELNNPLLEALVLNHAGLAHYGLNNYQQALELYQRALSITRSSNNLIGEATTLNNLGDTYQTTGEIQQSIEMYQLAFETASQAEDVLGQFTTLNNLGNAYSHVGDYAEAAEWYEQAFSIAQANENSEGIAKSLNNLGDALVGLGNSQQGIEYLTQALDIFQSLNHVPGQIATLTNLGGAYDGVSDPQQARDFYQQALDLAIATGDHQSQGTILRDLGNLHTNTGNYPQALTLYQQSLDIAQSLSIPSDEAKSLNNLGGLYYQLGNYQQALDFLEPALEINNTLSARRAVAETLDTLGSVYNKLNNYERAIALYELAISEHSDLINPRAAAVSLGNLGNVYDSQEDYTQAIESFQHSLAIAREIGDRSIEADTLNNVGNTHYALGDYDQAATFFQQSLEIKQVLGDRVGAAGSLANLGTVAIARGESARAEDALDKAVTLLDELRPAELSDRDRITLFETQVRAYKELERALIAQNKFEEALVAAERGRARSLIQLLSHKLLAEQSSQAPSFADIQAVAQEQQSVLVEYSLMSTVKGEASLYIWVVQPSGELDFREVPLGEGTERLTELISQSRKAIGVGGRGFAPVRSVAASNPTEQLRELYQLMIEPIAELLPEDPEQRVVFIPQGNLFLVPLPALINADGEHLIERHTLLTAPSIQALQLAQQQSLAIAGPADGEDILAVGDPLMPEVWDPKKGVAAQLAPLAGAAQEAQEIAALFEMEALLGERATEEAVKARMGNARIVHLATHGVLEYGTPEESGVRDVPGAIALTPTETEDGLLTAAEIRELDLQAELVVLSACDTGLGTITGDGVIGLSRSLIEAGTPSVIVSLWSIPDAPTAALMTEFYAQMQQGQDKAQALRQAMLIMMETHPDPGDWAAFTLIGEAD